MAKSITDPLFGDRLDLKYVPADISPLGVVIAAPRLDIRRNAGDWVTVVTLPATTAIIARAVCSFDIDIEPSRRIIITYNLSDDDTIYRRYSRDRGQTWQS